MMMVEGQTCCSGGSRLRISRVTDDGKKGIYIFELLPLQWILYMCHLI
jgi:hypothetical protein